MSESTPLSSSITNPNYSNPIIITNYITPSSQYNTPQYTTPQTKHTIYKLYHRRWFMLLLFSCCAFLNNLVCYTFAPVADLAFELYGDSFPISILITIFFITYVIIAFPAARFVESSGLRNGLVLGIWLQAIGSCIRCLDLQGAAIDLSGTVMIVFGQVIASLGQAFFVIPPPQLASVWFGDDERTFATTVACSADALGIAGAYIISPMIAIHSGDIPFLLEFIAILSFGLACIVTVLFEEAPSRPPSFVAHIRRYEREEHKHSVIIAKHAVAKVQAVKRQASSPRKSPEIMNSSLTFPSLSNSSPLPYDSIKIESPNTSRLPQHDIYTTPQLSRENQIDTPEEHHEFSDSDEEDYEKFHPVLSNQSLFLDHQIFETTIKLFKISGFIHTVVVFAIAESTINGFSTFMNSILTPAGFSSSYVSTMGFLFIVSAMFGSGTISYFVDTYKIYKPAIIFSFVGAISSMILFNLLSSTSHPPDYFISITASILATGFFVGPLQPVGLELAAECVYPISENSSTAIQQVMGNLSSAALVPLMMLLKNPVSQSMSNSIWALIGLLAASVVFASFFNGVYARSDEEARHKNNFTQI